MPETSTFGIVMNIIKVTIFSFSIVKFILPIIIGYFFYSRYLNKAGYDSFLNPGIKILHIIVANVVAGIIYTVSYIYIIIYSL